MTSRYLVALLFGAFFIFMLYRRARRHIGAQEVMPRRMKLRLLILTLVGALFLVSGLHAPSLLEADGAGLLAGALLAVAGLKMTRFEWRDEKLYYVPNLYVGLLVIAIILGRVVYKINLLYGASHGFADPQALQAVQHNQAALHSPVTLAVLMTLVGYYLIYYGGVLLRSRDHAEPDPV